MGRTSKRSPEREQAILNALRLGNTRRNAAAYAEIDQNTFYRWLDEVGTFRDAVVKAEADAEARFLGQIAKAAADGTWTAAAWWLERRRHEDFRKREQLEVTFDLRREAERIAAEQGLDEAEVFAEMQAILKGAR